MTNKKFEKRVAGTAPPAAVVVSSNGVVRLSASQGADMKIKGYLMMKEGGEGEGEDGPKRWANRWCTLLSAERRITYGPVVPANTAKAADEHGTTPEGWISLDNAVCITPPTARPLQPHVSRDPMVARCLHSAMATHALIHALETFDAVLHATGPCVTVSAVGRWCKRCRRLSLVISRSVSEPPLPSIRGKKHRNIGCAALTITLPARTHKLAHRTGRRADGWLVSKRLRCPPYLSGWRDARSSY